jgi:hypothetical protein
LLNNTSTLIPGHPKRCSAASLTRYIARSVSPGAQARIEGNNWVKNRLHTDPEKQTALPLGLITKRRPDPWRKHLRYYPVISWSIALGALLLAAAATAEQVPVRHSEGLLRGFLVLSTLGGDTIAGGEMNQSLLDGKVTNRLTFHFKDGSLHEETTVFTQQNRFRLVSYHLAQTGPSFPTPMDISIQGPEGPVVIRYTNEDGESKVETDNQQLPADIANGLVLTLLKNIRPVSDKTVVSMVGATPEPRLVDLEITAEGEDSFSAGSVSYKATHFVVKVDIGGITGVLAKFLGENPPDSHVWIVQGDSPGFVKAERPFYLGGPSWRIELASPAWPESDRGTE